MKSPVHNSHPSGHMTDMPNEERFRPHIKTFPATELMPYAEPVEPNGMKQGRVYFALQYLDDAGLVPLLTPLIFVGYDAEEPELRIFQSYESFLGGLRYHERTNIEDWPHPFECYGPDEGKQIFEYDKALRVLMRCALTRRDLADVDQRISESEASHP